MLIRGKDKLLIARSTGMGICLFARRYSFFFESNTATVNYHR